MKRGRKIQKKRFNINLDNTDDTKIIYCNLNKNDHRSQERRSSDIYKLKYNIKKMKKKLYKKLIRNKSSLYIKEINKT